MSLPGFSAEASLHKTTERYNLVGALEQTVSVNNQITPQQSLPIYGRYCGPGHSGPGAPIDAVDAVCKTHDECYGRRGYLDCRCDRNLILSMPGAIARTPTVVGKAAGAGVLAFFLNNFCVCRNRFCIPFVGCRVVVLPGRGGIGPC